MSPDEKLQSLIAAGKRDTLAAELRAFEPSGDGGDELETIALMRRAADRIEELEKGHKRDTYFKVDPEGLR
jgi:hypothetical protein